MRINGFTTGQVARGAVTALLTGALVFGSTPLPAWADDASSLESLQIAAIEAGEAYQTAQDKADALQAQIETNEARIAEIEELLPAQRERAAAAIRTHYKLQQGQGGLLNLILASETFNEFISQIVYLDAITNSQLNEILALNSLETELASTRASLETEKALVDQEVAAAQEAYANAEATKDAAVQKALEDAAAAQAAYEAQIAAGNTEDSTTEAIEAAEKNEASNNSSSNGSDTSSNDSSGSNSSSSDNSSSSNGSSSSSSGSSNDTKPDSNAAVSYNYVLASMYGEGDGFMYGTTASGAIVTPTSMGVAMKTMPLGTVIEITYNGNTCRAVVNDRGPFVGNRQIDLQPAVAHALGFDGVGTVGYRVIS